MIITHLLTKDFYPNGGKKFPKDTPIHLSTSRFHILNEDGKQIDVHGNVSDGTQDMAIYDYSGDMRDSFYKVLHCRLEKIGVLDPRRPDKITFNIPLSKKDCEDHSNRFNNLTAELHMKNLVMDRHQWIFSEYPCREWKLFVDEDTVSRFSGSGPGPKYPIPKGPVFELTIDVAEMPLYNF